MTFLFPLPSPHFFTDSKSASSFFNSKNVGPEKVDPVSLKRMSWWWKRGTLQETNTIHIGKRRIIFKHALSRRYVSCLEGMYNAQKKYHCQNTWQRLGKLNQDSFGSRKSQALGGFSANAQAARRLNSTGPQFLHSMLGDLPQNSEDPWIFSSRIGILSSLSSYTYSLSKKNLCTHLF